jgi:DNA-directed RNA polymerase subunit RPC12/RpoP
VGLFVFMSPWYANLLTDPRWHQLRKERLKIDKYRCQICGRGNPDVSLAVHHLEYVTGWMPWDYPLSMLQTLCFAHHEQVHVGQKPVYAECHRCKKRVLDAEVAGRDEKHEWVCEECAMKEEVKLP